MLQLRPNCEHCDKDLPADSNEAMICSLECTFCRACVKNILQGVCPNCAGRCVPRPVQPALPLLRDVSLQKYPASVQRVFKPVDRAEHADLSTRIALKLIQSEALLGLVRLYTPP